jgi:hypothetical protein
LIVMLGAAGCRKVPAFSAARVDRDGRGGSAYPIAVEPALVGTYPGSTKSGAGYFYDDVLEYRVWMHPERGATHLAGDSDYYAAFARYETAQDYSTHTEGAEEEPLVLVRQRETINEPTPGTFVWVKEERLTEWKVGWLATAHRGLTSIPDFLAKHRQQPPSPDTAGH